MDFRQVIEKNKRMTFLVILTYILIMLFVGLLADIATHPIVGIGMWENIKMLLSFKNTPYATIVILSLTFIGITVIHFWGHKWMMAGIEYQEITREEEDLNKIRMLNILEEMSLAAGLDYVPKLFIINTPEANAFAAGWLKQNAVVGITQGLIDKLDRSEIQAVIAHEVGHILHCDSKLTMYVGILANMILTLTDIFAHMFFLSGGGDSKEARNARMILLLLNFILPIVTRVLYLFLSRKREYMADAASVKLTGDPEAMISALEKISGINSQVSTLDEMEGTGDKFRSAAYIYSKGDDIFSTHPSVKNRINMLKNDNKKY